MLPSYAELHCLTNFSFLIGASHAEELAERAAVLGYTALAITDECSLAGVVRAHFAAKDHKLKLLIGSEFRLTDGPTLVLLATNREGYGNLSELITRARRSARKGSYRISRQDFDDGVPHCLALLVPGAKNCAADAHWLQQQFPGRAWIAVELLCGPDDRGWLAAMQEISDETGVPLVAAGGVLMHRRDRKRLQDVLTAIRLRTPVAQLGRKLQPNGERHLRSIGRLAKIYPSALLAETVAIAARCTFSLEELCYEYPEEIVPAGETPTSWLRQLSYEGLVKRYPDGAPAKVCEIIEKELKLIADLAYEPFFLTVYDVVRFARSRDILCQGRGSAANSAVCYCLGITEVDPSRTSVLFERFVSRERNEPPDIDVDFEHERREEVIQYVYTKYGRERAALAAAVATYCSKGALRDVGKALGLSLDQVDRLSKLASWREGRGITPEAFKEAGFDPDNLIIRLVIELASLLIGFPRHLSQHSGGVVIARDRLSRLVPIENAAMAERTVIQWDKDDLDLLGLLKVDILALGMLTAIRRMFDLVKSFRGVQWTMATIPPKDKAVYEMISRADTIGVFQIESRAQMSMLPRLRPECFDDLVIEVAIVRPGPIQGGMVHPYLRRREGIEEVSYPSTEVKGVLKRTLGVSIFQEQVMQIAMVAAGFTSDEADRLRRAMAAWKRTGGLEPFRERLLKGMLDRGYAAEYAEQIYQQIKGFGSYGFPESHATSFALLVYVSSWLKCHEPAAFTCGLLNSQPMGFYQPAQLVQDARRHGVEVRPVDVMKSDWDCTLERRTGAGANVSTPFPFQREGPIVSGTLRVYRENSLPFKGRVGVGMGFIGARSTKCGHSKPIEADPCLRLGLRMVKGLSKDAADRIVAARSAALFQSVEDLARRAALNRRDLAALAAADALAGLAGHRRNALWETIGADNPQPLLENAAIAEQTPLLLSPTEGENIVADYGHIGLTLRRHPLALLRPRLRAMRFCNAEELRSTSNGRMVSVAGIVTSRQRPATATGVTFITLEDETGYINVVIWNDLARKQRRELVGSRLLGVRGRVERQGEVLHVIAARLIDHTPLLGRLTTQSRDFH